MIDLYHGMAPLVSAGRVGMWCPLSPSKTFTPIAVCLSAPTEPPNMPRALGDERLLGRGDGVSTTAITNSVPLRAPG